MSLSSLVGLLGGTNVVKAMDHLEYRGVITGRSIEATLMKKSELEGKTINSLLDSVPIIVLMYVSDDGRVIKIMESPTSITPTYYELKKPEVADAVPSVT